MSSRRLREAARPCRGLRRSRPGAQQRPVESTCCSRAHHPGAHRMQRIAEVGRFVVMRGNRGRNLPQFRTRAARAYRAGTAAPGRNSRPPPGSRSRHRTGRPANADPRPRRRRGRPADHPSRHAAPHLARSSARSWARPDSAHRRKPRPPDAWLRRPTRCRRPGPRRAKARRLAQRHHERSSRRVAGRGPWCRSRSSAKGPAGSARTARFSASRSWPPVPPSQNALVDELPAPLHPRSSRAAPAMQNPIGRPRKRAISAKPSCCASSVKAAKGCESSSSTIR